MKNITTVLAILATAACNFSMAQDQNEQYEEGFAKYRVVAHKADDTEVKSYSNTITVAQPLSIYAPNAFSPDDDGINDIFYIRGNVIEEFHFQVYNRWGELVFETYDQATGWNGTYNGDDASIGGYVYQVTGRSVDGNESTVLQGTVALVR